MQCKKDSTHSEATKTKGYRLYPLLTQIEMTMHAPALAQQFTHLGHPNCSHRLLYLLRKIADMTEKYKRKQTNTRKTSKHYMRLGIPLFRKSNYIIVDLPRSNCLFCPVDHAVIRCCCRFFVGLANFSRAATCCEVASLLLSTPTSGWIRMHSCSGLVLKKPSELA